jgi:hypothetical protein
MHGTFQNHKVGVRAQDTGLPGSGGFHTERTPEPSDLFRSQSPQMTTPFTSTPYTSQDPRLILSTGLRHGTVFQDQGVGEKSSSRAPGIPLREDGEVHVSQVFAYTPA